MQHPPLKRHEGLKPLSRDHYGGLVQAKHLRQAADAEPDDRLKAVRNFLDEWNTVTIDHFEDEERLLVDLIPDRAQRDRLFDEHAKLHHYAEQAAELVESNQPPSPEWLRNLAALFNDHIRWEERELFPLIEQSADEQALAALESETDVIEQTRPRWTERCRTRE